ncbi:ribbon-helix-helix protein, CopG family [Cutibacterium sp.]|uniref:ribbon-helix-helix protein, CopG family n=1 Tax=Cutibacterium sp. TaxID=1912221 RepID=UPI0026DAB276|nr:ribbon-helix-helix protein, CopG family [Cutibacterium sp.]MDO4413049.1 ribbon-helix-helix protein, CopG family [Cutibacterium sp.]
MRTSTGRRLTDTVVNELVEAAAEVRRAGRPSLSGPGVHSPSVTVRLPQELNAKLDCEAARTGKRRSVIVREALEAALSS